MPRRSKDSVPIRAKAIAKERKQSNDGKHHLLTKHQVRWLWGSFAAITIVLVLVFVEWSSVAPPAELQRQAETATRNGDWATALQYWRVLNTTSAATSRSYLGEARACLALGFAAQAEMSLHRATEADPSTQEAWRLLLQILRVEDRHMEVQQLGWKAYGEINSDSRQELLRELTLGLIAELPDDLARATLKRWIDSDPADLDARIALWRRITAQPKAADPDRPSILEALEVLLRNHPEHIGAREALVMTLADAGEPNRGRVILDNWPELKRDAHYWRLRGRWELEYDHQPQQAVVAFQIALRELPQDWRSWYRLGRALHIVHRESESQRAAENVRRMREILDPIVLEPRLDTAFKRLDDVNAIRDLAVLCQQACLTKLASAWLAEANQVIRASEKALLNEPRGISHQDVRKSMPR